MFKKIFLILLFFISSSLAAKPVLTIYATSSFASDWGPGPAIKQAFEQECHCKVNILGIDDGATLLNRLRMEGEKSKADIILGLDNNLLTVAQQTGLFQELNIDTSALALPKKWHNTYFIPYDYGYFAFIYNQEKLATPPISLRELIENQQLKIIYQDPRTSVVGFGLLLWLEKVYGAQSAEAWHSLAKHTVTVTKGWSEAYGLFLKGEADLVLSYTTSPAYHLIDENDHRFQAAKFSEGHYIQIETAGIVKSSQQPELAEQFMRFMLTPAFQRHIATRNWMYPVINLPLPTAFNQLINVETSLEFSSEQIAKQRHNWIKVWQNATH